MYEKILCEVGDLRKNVCEFVWCFFLVMGLTFWVKFICSFLDIFFVASKDGSSQLLLFFLSYVLILDTYCCNVLFKNIACKNRIIINQK